MTFDRHPGSTAAETHVKFQNDLTDLDLYLDQEIGTWLKDKLQVHQFVPGQAITYLQMWRTSPASQIRVPWRNSQSGIWWINCWWNWRCWRSAGSHRGCTARCQFHPRHRRTPHNPNRNCSDTQGRRTRYRQPQAGTGKNALVATKECSHYGDCYVEFSYNMSGLRATEACGYTRSGCGVTRQQ